MLRAAEALQTVHSFGERMESSLLRYLFNRIAEAFAKAVTGDDHNVDFPCYMLCRTAVDLEGLAGTQSYLGARDHRVGTWFGLTALRALSVLQSLSLYSQPRLEV